MFDRGNKQTQCGKDSLFNKWCWKNWTDTIRKMKLDHLLIPHKNKCKMDQRLKCQTQNHKNTRRKQALKSWTFLIAIFFLTYLLEQGKQKKKISKWDYIKQKGVCTAKEIFNKIKRQPTECENIFTHASDKGLTAKNP